MPWQPRWWLSHAVVALLWLIHFLPLGAQARLGRGLGTAMRRLGTRRRSIVATNLRLCFPELDEAAREALAREHFAVLGRSFIERGLVWWASPERLRGLVRVEGLERLRALHAAGERIILLAPHFVGLDIGGTRMCLEFDGAALYSPQKDKVVDRWLRHGRQRFRKQELLTRVDNLRPLVRAVRAGVMLYYLPDMDLGRKDAIFVSFFGVSAATITALPRLARLTGARVVPCVARMLPGGEGYVVELAEPWHDYPGDDVAADTRRMNAWLEDVVRTMPAQYYWVHRRFKTRPEGEPPLYG